MSDDQSTGSERERTEEMSSPRVLDGKYRLGKQIGEGGMGAVYEAEHLGLGARVAVKLLSESGVTDRKATARFRREARAMGAIRHENVVAVMDTGSDEDGVPYLVMELLEGESLSAVLRRDKFLTAKRASWIATQVLAGLSAAHDNGIVHRDLKPGNVFLSEQHGGVEKVKILDFGISKLADASMTLNVTAEGAMIGTPNYMAPEQIRGDQNLDSRVDIYAVGILMYRMVTGRLPYAATSSDDLYRKVLDGKPVRPRARRPDIPEQLESVIMRAMHSERERRYHSASALRKAIHEAMPALEQTLVKTVTAPLRADTEPPVESDAAETRVARPSRHLVSLEGRIRKTRGGLLLGAGAAFAAIAAAVITIAVLRSQSEPDPEATAGGAGVTTEAGPPLRIGYQRFMEPERIKSSVAWFAEHLQAKLNRPVEIKIAIDGKQLATWLDEGEVDMAALSSAAYVAAKEDHALRLLAKAVAPDGSSSYVGYILTRRDTGIQSIADLRGRVFCYVQLGSTSGYVFPRALLRKQGIYDTDFRSIVFGGDHPQTLRLLENGSCDAASVFARAWHDAGKHGMSPETFLPIETTDPMPLDAYCVSGNMDKKQADELQETLLGLTPDSDLSKKLRDENARFIGFVPAADADYDTVRANLRVSAQTGPEPIRVSAPPTTIRKPGPVGPDP